MSDRGEPLPGTAEPTPQPSTAQAPQRRPLSSISLRLLHSRVLHGPGQGAGSQDLPELVFLSLIAHPVAMREEGSFEHHSGSVASDGLALTVCSVPSPSGRNVSQTRPLS